MTSTYIVDALLRKDAKSEPQSETLILEGDKITKDSGVDADLHPDLASRYIHKWLKQKNFSVSAWRVHKVTRTEQYESTTGTRTKPHPRISRRIETTTDEIVRDFTPTEAEKWRRHLVVPTAAE